MALRRAGRKRGGEDVRLDLRLRPQDRTSGPPQGRGSVLRPRRAAPPARETRKSGRGGGGRGRGKGRSLIGRCLYWSVVLALWAAIGGVGLIVWVGIHLPAIQSLEIPKRPPSVLILGLNGATLATRGDMGGAAVPLRELTDYVPKAFVAIEDRRFYSHHGVDPWGILRAIVHDVLRRGAAQGGSTITQQLAKNLFLTQERTVSRKLQELALAFWLEHKFTKAEILELYLNRVYFGAGAYGIEGAAQRYFGKSARQLTLAEAALLAGLVQSPSRLAPSHNPDGAERRARVVVAAMADEKLIGEGAAKLALARPAQAVKPSAAGSVNYVADWVMDAVDDLIGRFDQDIVVETAIDPALQSAAERALAETLAQKGEKLAVGEGALVAMTPDGGVRALVGGTSYSESQFDRAVAAKRQPGSAFKPFVYLTALEHGLTPDTVREDGPITGEGLAAGKLRARISRPGDLDAGARQFAQHRRRAPDLGVRAAGGHSHRLPARHQLAAAAQCLDRARHLGSLADRACLRLCAVRQRRLCHRAARGRARALERGQDAVCAADAGARPHRRRALRRDDEPDAARDARERYRAQGRSAGLAGGRQNRHQPGFPRRLVHRLHLYLVAGIWLGNDDNSPTRKATGGGLPVEIWSRFMKAAHQGVAPASLPGLAGEGWTAPAPQPPAAVGAGASRPSHADDGRLDLWLLDHLFGRR